MKKLILIASLLFSLNGWTQDENPFDALFEDEDPVDAWSMNRPSNGEYDEHIECFSNGKKIIDIDDVYVWDNDKNSIDYTTKNGWGEINPIRPDVTCHISKQEGWFD